MKSGNEHVGNLIAKLECGWDMSQKELTTNFMSTWAKHFSSAVEIRNCIDNAAYFVTRRLNLRFSPPGGPEIDVEGRVMWINPYRPGNPDNLNPGMGVQFVDVDDATQERILHLVKTFAYLDDDDDGPTLGNS